MQGLLGKAADFGQVLLFSIFEARGDSGQGQRGKTTVSEEHRQLLSSGAQGGAMGGCECSTKDRKS